MQDDSSNEQSTMNMNKPVKSGYSSGTLQKKDPTNEGKIDVSTEDGSGEQAKKPAYK